MKSTLIFAEPTTGKYANRSRRGRRSERLLRHCKVDSCPEPLHGDTLYCQDHQPPKTPEQTQVINDHIKINIEQSAKGARVTVTYDRSDHDIEVAVMDAILIYETTIKNLKDQGLKVDES